MYAEDDKIVNMVHVIPNELLGYLGNRPSNDEISCPAMCYAL